MDIDGAEDKPNIKDLFQTKAYRRLLPFIGIYWIIYIQNVVVMPSFGASWFAGCNEDDNDCEFDYIQYNFWQSLILSIRGLLGFLFSGFIGLLSDSFGRKPFILMDVSILCVNYLILSLFGNLWTWFGLWALNGLFSTSQALNAIMTAYISDIIPAQNLLTIGFSIILAILALSILIGTGCGAVISVIWNANTVFYTMSVGFGIAGLYCIIFMEETVKGDKKQKFNRNLIKNPFKPLTYINSHKLILYLGITAFFSQMITSSIGVTVIYINDQMNINESNKSVIMNMILFLSMSISGIIIAGFIVPFLKKSSSFVKDVHLIIGAFIILIIATFIFGILSFITDENGNNDDVEVYCIIIVATGSILLGAYALLETTIKSIIAQFVNENEQGLSFGVIQAMQNLMIIFGPFCFGYGYNLSKNELKFPSLLYFVVGIMLFLALFVAFGPLRRVINELEESKEKISLLKDDRNDENGQTSLFEVSMQKSVTTNKSNDNYATFVD